MTLWDRFQFAWRALTGHPLRSLLSLLGMAIGVASVVVLTALGEGARRYVIDQFSGLGTNLVIVIPGKTETTGMMPGIGGVPNDLTLSDYLAIVRSIPSVRQGRRPITVVPGAPQAAACDSPSGRPSESSKSGQGRLAAAPKLMSGCTAA